MCVSLFVGGQGEGEKLAALAWNQLGNKDYVCISLGGVVLSLSCDDIVSKKCCCSFGFFPFNVIWLLVKLVPYFVK